MSEVNLKIRQYWNDRAKAAKLNTNATTDDVFLRELEIRTFVETIKKLKKKNPSILDLGCGDGFTTIGVAKKLSGVKIMGIDYSENMISNACSRLKKEDVSLQKIMIFKTGDATKLDDILKNEKFDVIISSRCLINLTSAKQQFKTIGDISNLLKKGGFYISIENFADGNKELNDLRKKMDLEEIPVRWHNLFFKPKEYLLKTKSFFKKVEIINFSSAYYYATRVIYSKYCQMIKVKPDYNHEMHRLSIDLPTRGNYSPIKLIIHEK